MRMRSNNWIVPLLLLCAAVGLLSTAAFAASDEAALVEQSLTLPADSSSAEGGSAVVPADTAIDENTSFYAVAQQPVKVSFLDYDGAALGEAVELAVGACLTADQIPSSTSKSAAVDHWLAEGGEQSLAYEATALTTTPITADTTLRAAWQVSYLVDGANTALKTVLVLNDQIPTGAPETANDKTISGWLDAGGGNVTLSEQKITGDASFTAWFAPTLNKSDSVSYVKGLSDKNNNVYSFQPNAELTRAMAAQLIYGLLDSTEPGPVKASFSDVSDSAWYATSINTLASYGLLTGTSDSKFEPTRGITRAEFVKLICNLCGIRKPSAESPFTDVTDTSAWYYDAIMTAYEAGWITGYKQSDGSYRFGRQRMITRAEAVTIVNRVIGRSVDDEAKTRIDGYDWRLFADLADSHWAYYEIMEAVTGCGSSIPSTGLSAGRHTMKIGGVSQYVFINDDGRFMAVKKGLNVMSDGKSYYFSSAGISARVYSEGVYSLGGDLYLLDSEGSIIREPREGYESRVYEYSNRMYYIQEDGTLLQNEYYGVLYFGDNGVFTTGDSTLDSWLNYFIADIASSSKTQEEKLYDAYVAVRDYPLERYGYGYAGYYRVPGISSMSYETLATMFLRDARGTCAEWACAMVFLARRLGYQAAVAQGYIRSGAYHMWEIIQIEGTKYTFDVEQEWGRMYGYHNGGVRSDRDCWKMEYKPDDYINYGWRFDGTTYGNEYAGETNAWSPYMYNFTDFGF